MHRRGLQCLADLPGRRLSIRYYQTATATARTQDTHPPTTKPTSKHRNSTPSISEGSHGSHGSKAVERPSHKRPGTVANVDTAEFTKQLVRASSRNANKPNWKQLDVKNSEKNALRAKVTRRMPSEEKQQFMAANPDIEATDDYLTHEVVVPGTFVELRRHVAASNGDEKC